MSCEFDLNLRSSKSKAKSTLLIIIKLTRMFAGNDFLGLTIVTSSITKITIQKAQCIAYITMKFGFFWSLRAYKLVI